MERTKKKFLGIIAMVIVLVVIAVWHSRPSRLLPVKENPTQPSQNSLQQAQEFYAKQDYRNALAATRQVLTQNGSNVEAVVLMANILSDLRSPAALAWREHAVQLAPTLDNKVLLVSTALQTERPPFSIATETLEQIRYTAPTNIAYHMLASQLALRRDNVTNAEAELETIVRLDPTNQLHRLNLAVLHLQSANSAQAADARTFLNSLTNDPALGQHALRSLIADNQIAKRFELAEQLSQQLLSTTNATFEDRMQHLTLLNALKSNRLNDEINALKTEATTNAVYAGRLAQWMLAQQRPKEAQEWIKSLPDKISSTPPLPLFLTASYADLKDWSGLEEWLRKENWNDQDFFRYAWLAYAAHQQNKNDGANSYWQQAVSAAAGRIEALAPLVQLAGSWNWTDRIPALLRTIIQKDPKQNWAWQALLQERMNAGDTAGIYELYSEMLRDFPQSLIAKNNVALVDLLLNRNTNQATQLAKEVYLAATNNPVFVATYGYALETQGHATEGLQLMQTIPERYWLQPEVAVYYGALLAANGRPEAAQKFFEAATKGQMLPEEKQLVEKYSKSP